MNTYESVSKLTLEKWAELQPLELPPKSPVILWQQDSRTIYIEEKFGPPIPYGPVMRTDSESNYGYKRLKGNLHIVESIPELKGWADYAELITKINADNTPIVTDHEQITHQVGSYVDIIFSDPMAAQNPATNLNFAAQLVVALDGCEKWWSSAEIGIQRLKHLSGASRPLGVMLRLVSSGRSKDEARKCFQATLLKVGAVIDRLQH
jgi:hypothetical protein